MNIRTLLPSFSVVVPTYGRPQQLAACLEALANQDYPVHRFEVIVVDDGSPEPLDTVTARFRQRMTLRLIRQDNSGPAAARNEGASRARGDYIAFTDDDCAPAPTWLSELSRAFADYPDACIGGKTLNALEDNPYSAASQLLIDYLYELYHQSGAAGGFFASNNLTLPARDFFLIGGFDTRFPLAAAEDRELCDRLIARGKSMVYSGRSVVYHHHSLKFDTYARQHFNYGRGAYYFNKLKTKPTSWPLRRNAAAFYGNLLAYPLKTSSKHNAWFLVWLMFVSQVATTAGYFFECVRRPKLNSLRKVAWPEDIRQVRN